MAHRRKQSGKAEFVVVHPNTEFDGPVTQRKLRSGKTIPTPSVVQTAAGQGGQGDKKVSHEESSDIDSGEAEQLNRSLIGKKAGGPPTLAEAQSETREALSALAQQLNELSPSVGDKSDEVSHAKAAAPLPPRESAKSDFEDREHRLAMLEKEKGGGTPQSEDVASQAKRPSEEGTAETASQSSATHPKPVGTSGTSSASMAGTRAPTGSQPPAGGKDQDEGRQPGGNPPPFKPVPPVPTGPGKPPVTWLQMTLPEGPGIIEFPFQRLTWVSPLRHKLVWVDVHGEEQHYPSRYIVIDVVTGVILRSKDPEQVPQSWRNLEYTHKWCKWRLLANPTEKEMQHPCVNVLAEPGVTPTPRWRFAQTMVTAADCKDMGEVERRGESGERLRRLAFPEDAEIRWNKATCLADMWVGDLYPDEQYSRMSMDFMEYDGGPVPRQSPSRKRSEPSFASSPQKVRQGSHWWLPGEIAVKDLPTYKFTGYPSYRGHGMIVMKTPDSMREITDEDNLLMDVLTGELYGYGGLGHAGIPIVKYKATTVRPQLPRYEQVDSFVSDSKTMTQTDSTPQQVTILSRDKSGKATTDAQFERKSPKPPGSDMSLVTDEDDDGLGWCQTPERAFKACPYWDPLATPQKIHEQLKSMNTAQREELNLVNRQYQQYKELHPSWGPEPGDFNPTFTVSRVDWKNGRPSILEDGRPLMRYAVPVTNPLWIVTDRSGNIMRGVDGKPTFPGCRICGRIDHIMVDCYVPARAQLMGLDLDADQRPVPCSWCKSDKHPASRCPHADAYARSSREPTPEDAHGHHSHKSHTHQPQANTTKRKVHIHSVIEDAPVCDYCGAKGHYQLECPLLRNAENRMAEAVRTRSVPCVACHETEETTHLGCIHLPRGVRMGVRNTWWGKPCFICKEDQCFCDFRVVRRQYCGTCGFKVQGDLKHLERCPNMESCAYCESTSHESAQCMYVRVEGVKCFHCGSPKHYPAHCSAIGRTLREHVSREQCIYCCATDHRSVLCYNFPTEIKNEAGHLFCALCQSTSHVDWQCPDAIPVLVPRGINTRAPLQKPEAEVKQYKFCFECESVDHDTQEHPKSLLMSAAPPPCDFCGDPRHASVDCPTQKVKQTADSRRVRRQISTPIIGPAGEPRKQPPPLDFPSMQFREWSRPHPKQVDPEESDGFVREVKRGGWEPGILKQEKLPISRNRGIPRTMEADWGDDEGGDSSDSEGYGKKPHRGTGFTGFGKVQQPPPRSRPVPEIPYVPIQTMPANVPSHQNTTVLDHTLTKLAEGMDLLMQTHKEQMQHAATAAEAQHEAMLQMASATRERSAEALIESIPILSEKCHKTFATWLMDVENVALEAQVHPRNVAMKRSVGAVRQVISQFPQGTSWAKMQPELRRCFSDAPTTHQATQRLKGFRQKPDQSVRAYSAHYARMYYWASGLLPKEATSSKDITEFLWTLRNQSIRRKVNEKRPKSLDDAFVWADHFEHQAQENEALNMGASDVFVESVDYASQRDDRECDHGPREICAIAPPGKRAARDNACYLCGEVGHFQDRCTNVKKYQQRNAGSQNKGLQLDPASAIIGSLSTVINAKLPFSKKQFLKVINPYVTGQTAAGGVDDNKTVTSPRVSKHAPGPTHKSQPKRDRFGAPQAEQKPVDPPKNANILPRRPPKSKDKDKKTDKKAPKKKDTVPQVNAIEQLMDSLLSDDSETADSMSEEEEDSSAAEDSQDDSEQNE